MNILDGTTKISGQVKKGEQIGRTLDFPTANINYKGKDKIKFGVYGVIVKVLGEEFYGVINVGIRPTIDDSDEVSYEVNIFNFDSDIYDEKIECELIFQVREEIKFKDINELKLQIKKDIIIVKSKFGMK